MSLMSCINRVFELTEIENNSRFELCIPHDQIVTHNYIYAPYLAKLASANAQCYIKQVGDRP